MNQKLSFLPSESHNGMLVISSVHFTTAVILGGDDTVIAAAPIVKYMDGWYKEQVQKYCRKKGWRYEYINNRYRTNNSI